MTQSEFDVKLFEYHSYIADKFKDIQMQAQSLKTAEDELKVLQTLTKITDFATEIRKCYGEIDNLMMVEIEPEEFEMPESVFSPFNF